MMSNTPTSNASGSLGTPSGIPSGTSREVLCELFDGELREDAARFAYRRLGHDPQWRETCGRWQLAGDVMRRHASGVAPAGFADRVALALHDEQVQAVAPVEVVVSGASNAPRRRWIPGAALAASVAVAALFVARPLSNNDAVSEPTPAPASTTQVAASTPAVPAIESGRDATDVNSGETAVTAATSAVAVAEVSRRSSERRSRAQSQRAAIRVSRRAGEAPVAATALASTAGASTTATSATVTSADAPPAGALAALADVPASTAPDPFQPQPADTATSRPWPRAVLPGAASGGYTVSYGADNAGSRSFYPFEPRVEPRVESRLPRDSAVEVDAPAGADSPPQP
jgi:negative regulator of sigma E activity